MTPRTALPGRPLDPDPGRAEGATVMGPWSPAEDGAITDPQVDAAGDLG